MEHADDGVLQQNAVSLKLPIFWTSNPRVWFQQAEAQFALKRITADDTKYYYVVSALDQEAARRVIDLLEKEQEHHKYEDLKRRLLSTYSMSSHERAAKLINMPELGDRKPSALMDDMLSLLGSHTKCFLFDYIFLEKMPEDMRVVLATEDFTDPRRLAQRADTLWLARTPSQLLSAVKKPSRRQTLQKPDKQSEGMCFYHRRFGDKARQCCPPCTFQGNDQAGRPL